jgi:hypothetical protein
MNYISDIDVDGSMYEVWAKRLSRGEKTYSGIYGTANDFENATFYFGAILPTDYYRQWHVKYKVTAYVSGQDDYNGQFEVEFWGGHNARTIYRITNAHYNTNYRTLSCHVLYSATSEGVSNGYGHALGIGLQNSSNPTSPSYPRTFVIDIIETDNCTFTFYDSMVKFTSISGADPINYSGYSECDGYNNGLRDSGNSNDSGDDYDRIADCNLRVSAGENNIYGYNIIMETSDGVWQSLVTSYTNETAKGMNTSGFRTNKLFWYQSETAVTSGNMTEAGTLYENLNGADLRYATNCGTSLAVYQPVYLKGTIGSDGLFYLADTWWTQTLPTSDDGYVYIYLGETYNTYCIHFVSNHPVYWYKDGAVRGYSYTASHTHSYIPLSGSSSISGNLEFSQLGDSGTRGIIGNIASNDYWRIVGGTTSSNSGYLEIATADEGTEPIYVRQYSNGKFSTLARTAVLLDSSGNTVFPGILTAATFNGSGASLTSLNASNLSSGTVPIARIPTGTSSTTVALGDHTHSYLPLGGGTMAGTIILKGSVYSDALNNGALNANNSNIYNINQLQFGDLCDDASEGIQFYNTSSTVDSLWAKSGVLYFTPDRTWGSSGTNMTILHSGNYSTYAMPKNWANNTLYTIGDDVSMGDGNVAGCLVIKGLNGASGIQFTPYSGSTSQKISIDGNGTMTITGTVAGTFSGSGASLTSLNASNLSSGTIPIARIPTGTSSSTVSLGNHTHSYLPLSGGTMTGQIQRTGSSSSWIAGRTNAMIRMNSISGYSPFASIKTTNGSWDIGTYDNSSYTDDLIFSYCTDTNFSASTNSVTSQIRFYEDGTILGNLSGNSTTATKLQTARTLTIGSTGKTFDGSGNVSWSLSEIGAAASSHTHSYIPLSGSTAITGVLRSNSELQTTSANAFRTVCGNYGCFIRNDGGSTYVLLTASGDQYGTWNSLRPLTINNSTGVCNISGNAATATTASNLSYFTNTSTTNMAQDTVTANAIGYISDYSGTALTSGITDGACYKQVYSSSWSHMIYGDYRTGHIAVRGKNNGTWQSWLRVLDEGNYSSFAVPLSGNSTVSGAITFNGSDSYGIRTSKTNYGAIGASSYYFYQSYINYMYAYQLLLYNSTSHTYKSTISAANVTSNITQNLPNYSGTFALREDFVYSTSEPSTNLFVNKVWIG